MGAYEIYKNQMKKRGLASVTKIAFEHDRIGATMSAFGMKPGPLTKKIRERRPKPPPGPIRKKK